MTDFDVNQFPNLGLLSEASAPVGENQRTVLDPFQALLEPDLDVRPQLKEIPQEKREEIAQGLFDEKFDSFSRRPDAERTDFEGFELTDLPMRMQRDMAPVFEIYSGEIPGQGDGFMSQLDMKDAMDDGVVEFRFVRNQGFKPQVNLDNIPWEDVAAFLANDNIVEVDADITVSQFVASVERLMGGDVLGLTLDPLAEAKLHELHGEITSLDGVTGATSVELALLLQSDDYSLEGLLPPRPEGERGRKRDENKEVGRLGQQNDGRNPTVTMDLEDVTPFQSLEQESFSAVEAPVGPFSQANTSASAPLDLDPMDFLKELDLSKLDLNTLKPAPAVQEPDLSEEDLAALFDARE